MKFCRMRVCGGSFAGIDEHDTLAGHHHERIGVVAPAYKGIDIFADFLELGLIAGDGACLRGEAEGDEEQ